MDKRLRVLFLCTGNTCRSQMAEGWVRHLKNDWIAPYSAGVAPGTLDARAVAVMAEAGVDISGHSSKSLAEVMDVSFNAVVTVCDDAHESCPVFPAKTKVVHRGFDDPPRLSARASSENEALGHYRRVRDEIRAFVEELPESLGVEANPGSVITKESKS
jgi:arsenate reductase